MKKKITFLIAGCLLLMSSAVFASPLTDYSLGKASFDLTFRNSKNSMSGDGDTLDFSSKYNFEPSFTVGLGNKWAFQYRNVGAKSGDSDFGGDTYNSKIEVNEFNALYQLGTNVSAFVGYVSAKGTVDEHGYGSISDRRNTWQLGLVGSVPLAEKFTAYGLVGAGDKWTNYEIGVAYAFTPNFEFNLDYRHLKAKGFESEHDRFDGKMKGFGFGLTYKL